MPLTMTGHGGVRNATPSTSPLAACMVIIRGSMLPLGRRSRAMTVSATVCRIGSAP